MKNSFFKEMAMIGPGFQVSMTIKESHGKLIVTVLPHGLDNVAPIIASGTPDELDEGFCDAIRSPLIEAHGIVVNKAEYEASLKAAKKKPAKAGPKKLAGSEEKPEKDEDNDESGEEEEAESDQPKEPKPKKPPVTKDKAPSKAAPVPEAPKQEGAKPVSLF